MRAFVRSLRRLWPLTLTAAVLSACASAPQGQYFTLSPPGQQAPASQSAATEGTRAGLQPPNFAISVQPARVPEQYDRPQIVLATAGSNEVTLLNHSQWASPLPEEIRHAVSYHLTQELGVLDIPFESIPSDLPVWEISLDIQRFDSVWNSEAVLDSTWRLTPRNMGKKAKSRICGAEVRVPVESGVAPLVEGHRQALESLSRVIAGQLRQSPATRDPTVQFKGCTP